MGLRGGGDCEGRRAGYDRFMRFQPLRLFLEHTIKKIDEYPYWIEAAWVEESMRSLCNNDDESSQCIICFSQILPTVGA
jgi:hypothetical protein